MVEPPSAFTKAMAFSIDFLEIISKGFKSCSNRFLMATACLSDSDSLFGFSAGIEELYGKEKPIHSIAEAIVFAVYIPPHAPAPGIDLLMISLYSSSSISPATF